LSERHGTPGMKDFPAQQPTTCIRICRFCLVALVHRQTVCTHVSKTGPVCVNAHLHTLTTSAFTTNMLKVCTLEQMLPIKIYCACTIAKCTKIKLRRQQGAPCTKLGKGDTLAPCTGRIANIA